MRNKEDYITVYCGTLTFEDPIDRDALEENRNWFNRFIDNITVGLDPARPTYAVFCYSPGCRVQHGLRALRHPLQQPV